MPIVNEVSINNNFASDLSSKILLALATVTTVAMIVWVLWFCRYGIDFSDEAFYLVWISNPFIYSVSVTQFGYVYHPLYILLDGNIAALRQANLLITFCLGWVFCAVFLRTIFKSPTIHTKYLLIISAVFASSSLIRLYTWLPTPSYNSLTLQALLLAATGMLLTTKDIDPESVTGSVMIGLGGWLAFMAKPTSAAVLGVSILLYLILSGKLNFRLLLLSAATAIFCLAIFAISIDGSVASFIERLKGGLEISKVLNDGYSTSRIFRLDGFRLSGVLAVLILLCSLILTSAIILTQSNQLVLVTTGTLMSAIIALSSLAIILGLVPGTLNQGLYQGLLIWSVPFSVLIAVLVKKRLRDIAQITRPQWTLAVCFAAFPHVFSFGSGNNYWAQGAIAGIFWVVAGLVILCLMIPAKRIVVVLLPIGLATQLITILLIQTNNDLPYRQPQPLRDNNYKIEVGRKGSDLILSQEYGRYFQDAMNVAAQANFKRGTPVVDLTGHSPGILYALEAISIGQAWTIGGYPGSDKLAMMMLAKVACQELAAAWLLTEPDGPREISAKILSSFGTNIATDFELVGSFFTAAGAGSYQKIGVQSLLKPIRDMDIAISQCLASEFRNQ